METINKTLLNENQVIFIEKMNFKKYYKIHHYINILKYETRISDIENNIYTTLYDLDDDLACKFHDAIAKELSKFNYEYKSIGADEINHAIFINDSLNEYILDLLKQLLMEQAERLTIDVNCQYYKRFKYIKDYFKITDLDLEILIIQYIFHSDDHYSTFMSSYCDMVKVNNLNLYSLDFKARVYNYPYKDVMNAYSTNSKLVKYGLLTSDTIQISNEIVKFIEGFSEKPLEEYYYARYCGETLKLDDFPIPQTDKEILVNLLGNRQNIKGIKILLYGRPGTGKTEFARCIARTMNYQTYILNQTIPNEPDSRYTALNIYENLVNDDKSILIIDEAEDILESVRSLKGSINNMYKQSKGVINTYIENSKTIQIWIVNNSDYIDESTMRRFNYSIEFSDLTFYQRKVIWNNLLEKYNYSSLLNENDIVKISDKYEVNAGPIKNALENFMQFKNHGKNDFLFVVKNTLKSHIKLTKQETPLYWDNKIPMFERYDISGLNIKTNITKTLSILERFNGLWNAGDLSEIRNLNVLMWGPPGTGKTEMAKYIARRLKRKLIIKNASDILSAWVGNTESNIASAFKESEREKSILLIDEIDGLLGNRQRMEKPWEVTQVNELLIQMENFHGVLICATNNIGIVDAASIRRFSIKLEFDYLTDEGAIQFFNLYFSKILSKDINNEESSELISIKNLTPGDFKIVYHKLLLSGNFDITVTDIIDELRDETKIREYNLHRRMGFIA